LVAVAAGFAACRRSQSSAEAPVHAPLPDGGRGATEVRDWTFSPEAGANSPAAASIIVPTWGAAGDKFPVVIALHGRGEARKSPKRGARGWADDYTLTHTIARAAAPPLTRADYEDYVRDADLASTNDQLSKVPFGGLIVACPYLPDLDLQDEVAIGHYATWLIDVLLPRVHRETPALTGASATGIDGVSLGGAVALHAGLAHPEAFGALGTLQPAIDSADAPAWTARAKAARAANPALRLRLTTSEDDPFRRAVVTTSTAWKSAGIAHDLEVLPGPHDYPFNRGPGGFSMLLWHDRVLRAG
jgi:hypothetical protein